LRNIQYDEFSEAYIERVFGSHIELSEAHIEFSDEVIEV
jgi:hypothetical protein